MKTITKVLDFFNVSKHKSHTWLLVVLAIQGSWLTVTNMSYTIRSSKILESLEIIIAPVTILGIGIFIYSFLKKHHHFFQKKRTHKILLILLLFPIGASSIWMIWEVIETQGCTGFLCSLSLAIIPLFILVSTFLIFSYSLFLFVRQKSFVD